MHRLLLLSLSIIVVSNRAAATNFPVTVFTDLAPTAGGSATGAGDGPGNAGDLRAQIIAANTAGGAGNTITFVCSAAPATPCTIPLSGPLPPIDSNLVIDGGTFGDIIIDGNNLYRVFFADTGTITLTNLQIQNAMAQGGVGGDGTGPGGGGAGFGAGLFVNQVTAIVTVENTYFLNCNAAGGNGGHGIRGGDGAAGGGSLGGFIGGTTSIGGTGAGGAGMSGPGIAGTGLNGGNGGPGGGGGGGAANGSGAGGIGGIAYGTNDAGMAGSTVQVFQESPLGSGGFGGGGGGGGTNTQESAGGFGGGGGGDRSVSGNQPGNGGFGGGTGGAVGEDSNGNVTTVGGIRGGYGGYGGMCSCAHQPTGGGGGGAAGGPAIFVNLGSVTIANSTGLTFSATAGLGGTGANSGYAGTADATPVFNYGGTVNNSSTVGPIAGALALGLPAPLSPPPVITAAFSPSSVPIGGTGTTILTITLTNPNAFSLTGVGLNISVPNGLFFDVPILPITCIPTNSGNVGTSLFLTGVTLPPSSSCTLSLAMHATAPGSIVSSSTGTSDQSGAAVPATATLTVSSPPSLMTSFGAGSIAFGGSTTLSFKLTNMNLSGSLTGIGFTDNLPAGLVVSTPNGLSSPCGTVTATAGSGSVSMSGLTLSASGTCTFSLGVTGIGAGLQINTTSPVTSVGGGTGSLASASIPVNQQNQTITFGAIANQNYGPLHLTLGASASSNLAVSFASLTPLVCTVLGSSVTFPGTATCTIQATQAGNANYAAAPPISQSFQVLPASQTITFGALSNLTYVTMPVMIGATASSNLGVTFASLTPSICTVVGISVTLAAPGTCNIQATQAGNADYLAAAPVSQSFQVFQDTQTIVFGTVPVHTYGGAPFALSGTATSGLLVHFTVTSGPCTVSTNAVTINGAGICVLAANQTGNLDWRPAPSVVEAFTVSPAVLTVTANDVTIPAGSGLPVFTAQLAGFVLADTAAAVSGAPRVTTTATSSSPAGRYPIIATTGTLAAPDYIFQFVNGTLTVSSPPPPPNFFSTNPAALTLQYVQGTTPASLTQGFSVYANPASTPFTVVSSAVWLVAPSGGTASNNYSVDVNPQGLALGAYKATLSFSSTSGSVLVPVTLTVLPPPTLSSQPATLQMMATFGTTMVMQDTQLSSSDGNVAFTATSNAPWLTFTASGGSTPATLHIQANPSGLPAATYLGALAVTVAGSSKGPYSILVNLVVTGTGAPSQSALDSSGSFGSAKAAPNTILTLFGPNACSTQPQIIVNGDVAEILFAGPTQINFVIPGVASTATSATIQVVCNGVTTESVTLPAASVNPAIFTQNDNGSGEGSILNQDGTVNDPSNRALPGSYVTVYVTGFGTLNSASADGLRRLTYPVTATIGGIAANVSYAGEAPDKTSGLQQINIRVPANAPTGPSVAIILTVNGVSSQSGATLAVQ